MHKAWYDQIIMGVVLIQVGCGLDTIKFWYIDYRPLTSLILDPPPLFYPYLLIVPTITANIEVKEGNSCSTVGERYSLICRITSPTDLSQSAISYQWQHNGEILPSEVSQTLAFQPLQKSHTGDYSCQVTLTSPLFQEAVTVTSNTHTLELEVMSESIQCITREQGKDMLSYSESAARC
ncbi:MAG: hypothetical protein A6F71_09345 [Cycloclasticus sp. symbiont of Poecilosclerida sp. M]|nr:MAG: hypothetical protein A6F71_09345 [Cycloclasticus sp. symbiont of Poecilosclerida sp. M]